MHNVSYRDARLGDAEQMARISSETFASTFGHLYRSEDLAAYLAETRSTEAQAHDLADPGLRHQLALDASGAIIGYATMGVFKLPYDPGPRRPAELHRLYVIEAAKGKGVADRLMDWTLAQSRALGAEDLYLGVYRDNERAQRFYRRYGFEIVGEYLFHVGEARDAEYIMRKAL